MGPPAGGQGTNCRTLSREKEPCVHTAVGEHGGSVHRTEDARKNEHVLHGSICVIVLEMETDLR